MKNPQRRTFLKKAALDAIGTAGLPSLVKAYEFKQKDLPKDLTILFQGDSITDAWRHKDRYYPNDSAGMGNGYVYQAVAQLLGKYPDKNMRCYNRGISGNKVFQLANRWEDDCLQLKPDVLSLLIGVNDFWHTLSHNYKGTAKVFEKDLRALLDRTKKAYPNIKLIIGEPFAVEGGTAIGPEWYPAFNAYRQAAKQIASDYGAAFIPYQTIFDEALQSAPVSFWCADGVHPSIAGGYLMAQGWLKAFDELF